MGDMFRKQQAKNFRKKRDRAMEEAGRPRLFSRPEVIRTVFTLIPKDGVALHDNERCFALTEDSAGPVYAVRGHEKIAIVDGDGAEVLRQAIASPDGPGIAELRITSVSEISGTASAELVFDQAGN